MPKGLPLEQILSNQAQFSAALIRWNSSMEPLEALMAPYLNYHYASAPAALVGQIQKWGTQIVSRMSSQTLSPEQRGKGES